MISQAEASTTSHDFTQMKKKHDVTMEAELIVLVSSHGNVHWTDT